MHILITEDDEKISNFIVQGLLQHGYKVTHVGSAEAAEDIILNETIDLAIIDIMLPKKDGLTLVRELRGQGVDFPLLILSAKRTVEDRILGLRQGGDDYLTKPFSFNELLARIEALTRRQFTTERSEIMVLNTLQYDPYKKIVTRKGEKIILQPKELMLLEFLFINKNRLVSRTQILEHVWDYQFDPQTNVVDVLVCRLRSKIDRANDIKLLHTIRGMGYVLKEEPQS